MTIMPDRVPLVMRADPANIGSGEAIFAASTGSPVWPAQNLGFAEGTRKACPEHAHARGMD